MLLFFLFFAFSNCYKAQPVLTFLNNAYTAGELFSVLKCDYQSPGLSGINQLWDFSSALATSNQTWITHTTTVSVASSTTAINIELFDSTNNRKYYFSFFNDSAFGRSDEVLCVSGFGFSPLKYPFTFGDSYYNVCGNSTYDAFGTLKLPYATFNNVIRIKSISSSVVRGYLGGGINNEFIGDTHDTTYFWYLPNTHFPIAKSINSSFPHKNSGIVTASITKNFYYINNIVAGFNDINFDFKCNIFPNPTNGILTINSNTELQKIEVLSMTGQVLLMENPIGNTHTLYLENFSDGIYFLNLHQNNKIVKRDKIVLNK